MAKLQKESEELVKNNFQLKIENEKIDWLTKAVGDDFNLEAGDILARFE